MVEMDVQSKIDEAKAAADQNKFELARKILNSIIQQDPQNAQAWMVMSEVVDNPTHAVQCLEQVLKLEPNNSLARQKLDQYKDWIGYLQTPSQTNNEFLQELSSQLPDPSDPHQPSTPTQPPDHDKTSLFEEPEPQQPELSTPPFLNIQPQPKQEQPQKPQKSQEQPKDKSGRWLEISLLVVLVMCAIVVIPLVISQYIPRPPSGPTPTVEDVRIVIYENMDAANKEDIDRYMDTIHPRAAGRSLTKNAMQDLFVKYDLYYNVTNLDILEIGAKEARVAFVLTTRKVNGPAFQDNLITGVMILRFQDGSWKIYDQELNEVTYLD